MLGVISVYLKQTASIKRKTVELFHHTCYALYIYLVQSIIILMAFMFFYIPYNGFGISTMFVILWRLINGKTGYKTHFKNLINTP